MRRLQPDVLRGLHRSAPSTQVSHSPPRSRARKPHVAASVASVARTQVSHSPPEPGSAPTHDSRCGVAASGRSTGLARSARATSIAQRPHPGRILKQTTPPRRTAAGQCEQLTRPTGGSGQQHLRYQVSQRHARISVHPQVRRGMYVKLRITVFTPRLLHRKKHTRLQGTRSCFMMTIASKTTIARACTASTTAKRSSLRTRLAAATCANAPTST